MTGYNVYFPVPLVTTHLADGINLEVLYAFVFHDPVEGVIEVPIGAVTDLASTPRSIWIFLPPHGRYKFGAVIHDHLYDTRPYGISFTGWRRSDRVLWRAMTYAPSEISSLTKATIYIGLLVGGWWPYFRVRESLAQFQKSLRCRLW
jgi:hypothetical protein